MRADRRALWWATVIVLCTALFGFIGRTQILLDGLALPRVGTIFFRLYALHEALFLLILLLSAVLVGALALSYQPSDAVPGRERFTITEPGNAALGVLALLALVVSAVAASMVMHRLPFSMDEWNADFQARIFASGRYAAPLPAALRSIVHAITPVFVTYLPDSGSWVSPYLPGYALLKTPFVALGIPTLLNPLLAALTVLATGGAARRLWPGDGVRQWLALLLLVTSSQFLATSASSYSMPAHLCLNMVWLYLYLRGDRRSFTAALFVGAFALALHQPFPHALFVAPFLVRLVRERRWQRVGAAVLVYGASAVACLAWMRLAQPIGQGGGGLLSAFAIPGSAIVWVNALSFSLLLTWQAPVLGFLALAAFLRARQLDKPLADLAWGVVLTLGFYLLYPSTQGHGWGHRYAYQILGNLVLLACAGLGPMLATLGERRTRIAVSAALLVAVAIQLPLRAVRIERFVAPFATGYNYVTSRNADVVLVHGGTIWYGIDMLRNDPSFRGQPLVVMADALTPPQLAELLRAHPGRVVEISDDELARLGMIRRSRLAY